jgi:N-acetylmuramoyl-L-alanine amidase
MQFVTKKGFFTSEFWGTLAASMVGILPALSGSGNPIIMAVGAIMTLLYKHGRFTKKRDMALPGFTDSAGIMTSEWFIGAVWLVSGIYQEMTAGTSNHILITIGLVMTALHNIFRGKLKDVMIGKEVAGTDNANSPDEKPGFFKKIRAKVVEVDPNEGTDEFDGITDEQVEEVEAALGLVAAAPRPFRVALVVGHNSRQKGADSIDGNSEFDFNNAVADILCKEASTSLQYRRFNRAYSGAYTREIDTVYSQVAAWKPDLILELHFNAGRGNYTTMLVAKGSTRSIPVANILNKAFASGLGVDNGGVKPVGPADRGGRGLFATKYPTILTEPFFGDNPKHKGITPDRVAGIYRAAINQVIENSNI